MERVSFLVDATGERVDCLLNPETVQVSRLAGVRARGSHAGQLTGVGLADDPLLFTGGGRTELRLDLLFDVELVDGQSRPQDVRALTRRLWMLAENSAEEHGAVRPPLVRLVWGKAWNVPGVIVAVAERFDDFTPGGSPRRSWLRMRLVRTADSAAQLKQDFEEELQSSNSAPSVPPGGAVTAVGDSGGVAKSATGKAAAAKPGAAPPGAGQSKGHSGVRFDLISNEVLGSPLPWRALAEHNNIANPLDVAPGTVLSAPPVAPVPGGAPVVPVVPRGLS
ncbi:CIS tube protein [Phytohabitans houttuyneae]|uniref:Contractile injection system tube protein N-terminal domain-containing protein n=1 Tax=Phytohabitans houttuyneae TaxID=1076126 RepID=A0A6V8KNW4_9ACTN|nr:hypothetical protein [Phytohabitans houttuyneae]GFJ83457.1 hypothetical protein Phou_076370 [Phytohabitans houttuyneae]